MRPEAPTRMSLSAAHLRDMMRAKLKEERPSKYRNKIVGEDGQPYDKTRHKERFQSVAEWEHWRHLCIHEKAGDIAGLRRQPQFPLIVNGVKVCTYVGDFYYRTTKPTGDGPCQVVDEVKGYETATWKMKRKLFEALHPAIQLRVIGGRRSSAKRASPRMATARKRSASSNMTRPAAILALCLPGEA